MFHNVRLTLLPLALIPACVALPAWAQDDGDRDAGQEAPVAEEATTRSEPDIIVRALRLREDDELPVETRPATGIGSVSRRLVADSAMFTRCAGLPRMPLLRRIVDGRPDTGETKKALHQHVMRNSGCFQGMPMAPPMPQSPYYGACNPILLPDGNTTCRVTYDRGAIYEQVLREYAPGLTLSRSNTFDHATRDRFRAREEQRNSARRQDADDYFFIAACMVQLRPEYALALLREEPGSDREGRLRALMISDGAPCVGGVEVTRVRVDPGQFRAFVAEAVYSWAVAVRRDSLLPSVQE